MGLSLMSGSGDSQKVLISQPDARRFVIVENIVIGSYVILKLKYEGCTNYNGYKISVYEKLELDNHKFSDGLDPHFLDDGRLCPIARFEPTVKGMHWARMLVEVLVNGWR